MTMPSKINPNGIKILIAEDSPTQAEQIRFLLAGAGFAVRVAGNGRQALDMASAEPPQLVITDIVMPEMDGYELCARIKADPLLKDIPVVMVTSLAGIQDIARSLECGADNFIRKPYEPKTLLTRIEYILLNLELRKTSKVTMGMEIYLGGKKHFIASGREQIVDLLISTYEEAVHINEELQQRQLEIALSNRTLNVLYRIAGDLNRVAGEDEICQQALCGILELPLFRAGWIDLADASGGLHTVAASQLPADWQETPAAGGACRCRRMLDADELRHGAALIECDRLPPGDDGGYRPSSHITLALSMGEQRLGLINIVAEEGLPVGADDLRLLESIGSQLAIAIQRAQLCRHLEELVSQRTAALQAEIVERTRAETRVASLNRIYAVLSGINSAIVRLHEPLALFAEACRVAVDEGQFGMAWIALLDRDGQAGRFVAGIGAKDFADRHFTVDSYQPEGQCPVGKALHSQRAAFCNDITATPSPGLFLEAALEHGYRSLVALPLLRDQGNVGVMVLYARESGFFNEKELCLLDELAGDLSFALEYIAKAEQLDYLAYYDVLTGLPNRRLIHDRLEQLLQSAHPEQDASRQVALVLLNIERFKNINDSFGRRSGDALLKQIAARFAAALGGSDHLARLSGDHFAAILAEHGAATELARVLGDTLLASLDLPFSIDGHDLHITAKAGVAVFPGDGGDADALFANAETALHKATASEERYLFYAPPMNARVAEQLTLENRLHKALARNEFVLHYQPKVNLQSGQIVGLEALIRWNDPETGLVAPKDFIPLLEETGLIVEVGRWALQQAVADYEIWHAGGLQPPRVAVNVSAVQLRRKDFLATLEKALSLRQGERNYLDLELTESMLMEDIEANVRRLRAAREMGVKIAIDDFGTGYSSLSYLKRFPIDLLKIDASFVSDITTDPDAAAICIAVIGLAHNLKLKVIAEGVETAGQMNYLRRHRCDEMQGYLFSRPLPATACAELLAAHTTLELPLEAAEHRTLLIVDDENNILQALKRVLRHGGYEILTAGSAREGFDLLARHAVQVILSDQRMPEMNGTEFLSRVRELYPDTIRIVLSGYTDLETITNAVNRGAIYRFLTKPWDDDLLREHVREAFRHQEMTDRKR
ncbi:MAG: EAL domain-containing protein [Rhodocyclaceae bacterium]